jgi:uncharacterized OB-fold protein
MGFEKFGMVSFTSETKAQDFVTYLEEGKVMATRCKQCGQVYFPPRMDCADCIDSEVEWFEITDKGKLVTYTTVNYGPTGFEDDTPYILAVAEFPSGVKVFGRLEQGMQESDIETGMSVRLVSLRLPNENVSYTLLRA